MRKYLMLFTLFLTSVLLHGTETVSLDSCRRMAIRDNKSIKTANEHIVGAGYNRKAAKAAYLPAIDFTMGYMYNQHNISLLGEDAMLPTMTFDPQTQSYHYNLLTDPQTGKPVVNPATGSVIPSQVAVIPKSAMSYDIHNVVAGALTLTQPVYMGGRIKAMNEITKYAEQLAQSMRDTQVQDVVYAVDQAYWTVVSLKSKQKLAESYVELLDTLRFKVNAMIAEGFATRSDKLSVDVKCNEAQISLTKVCNGLSLARMALAQVCGLPVNTVFELEDENLSTYGNIPCNAQCNISEIFDNRHDLQSMRTGINIYRQKEKLALSEMLPQLAIVGAYSFQNPNTIDGFENRFGGGFSVGATLTIPIWHWGGKMNKLRAARSETAAQTLKLEQAEEMVTLQVEQARFRYEESFKTLKMTESNLEKADENLRQSQLGFAEGMLTIDDVITAQTAWLQANSEKIDAQIDIQLCRVYLSKVTGTMDY